MGVEQLSIDKLINGAIGQSGWMDTLPFLELFNKKLEELQISKHQALKIIDVDNKGFDAFINGSSSKIDFLTIKKLSVLLELNENQFIDKFLLHTEKSNSQELRATKENFFIAKNFKLENLKKIGLIDTVNDFDEIKRKINTFFGYESIFEYNKDIVLPVYSSGMLESDKDSQKFWVNVAATSLGRMNNPNAYDREALIKLFPTLRAYSLNIEHGLLNVAKLLYKVGVSLTFVPKMFTDLHIRAATFSINNKPAIALTDYKNYYPTLWFALIHELYHVLYDWEEIIKSDGEVHLSGDSSTSSTINEDNANEFARKYLFSKEKMANLIDEIDDPYFVLNTARANNIHESIIYALFAYENTSKENKLFGKYKKFLPPCYEAVKHFVPEQYQTLTPIPQIIKQNLSTINN